MFARVGLTVGYLLLTPVIALVIVASTRTLLGSPAAEPEIPQGKVGIGFWGDNGKLVSLLANDGRYFTYNLDRLDLRSLRKTRVLVVHNLKPPVGSNSDFVRELVRFVERGGALFLAGDTCRSIASPFPEVATSWIAPYPRPVAPDDLHIDDRLMKVTDGRWIIEEFTGQVFEASSSKHLVLKMGPAGRTVVLDRYDWPVIIGGTDKSDKVIFSGCDYSDLKIPSKEADVTRTLLAYLAGFAGGPLKQ